jgi:hypothetical protein
MSENFDQVFSLYTTRSNIDRALKKVVGLPKTAVHSDEVVRYALNHLINSLDLRRSYIHDSLDLDVQCTSASCATETVSFQLRASTTRAVEPREYWKKCADRFTAIVRTLADTLGTAPDET